MHKVKMYKEVHSVSFIVTIQIKKKTTHGYIILMILEFEIFIELFVNNGWMGPIEGLSLN